ncbi:hypothetical protein [Psychroserpens algicola]|uniref:hypothetical protein n=1 Tax=Psychroserpens algicola TaxID=1719034 RepID=UPI001954E446|nr:hypothetical protein [Psychroserpens algicola]
MRLLLILIFGLYTISSTATVQEKDMIIYDGEIYELQNFYLEQYFEIYPSKRPKNGISSSNLWRGYLAVFTISNDHLHLIDLLIQIHDKDPSKLFATKWESVFDEFSPECDEFLIFWIKDLILLPQGEVVDYQPGFGVSFSDYELLEFSNGELIDSDKFSLDFYKMYFTKCHLFLKEEDLLVMKEKVSD